jgi:hypothetical protein
VPWSYLVLNGARHLGRLGRRLVGIQLHQAAAHLRAQGLNLCVQNIDKRRLDDQQLSVIVLDQPPSGHAPGGGACPAGAPSSTWPLCPPTERVDRATVYLEAHRVVPADGWSWPLASRGSPARRMGWLKDGWKIPNVCTSSSTTCGMAHSAMPSHLWVFHHSALPSCGGVTAEVDRPLHTILIVIMVIII